VTGVVHLPEGTEMVMPGRQHCDGSAPDRADRDGREACASRSAKGGRTVGAGVVASIIE